MDMPEQDESSKLPLQRTAFDILKLFKDGLNKEQEGEVEMTSTNNNNALLGERLQISPAGYSVVFNEVEVEWTGPTDTNDDTFGDIRTGADPSVVSPFSNRKVYWVVSSPH